MTLSNEVLWSGCMALETSALIGGVRAAWKLRFPLFLRYLALDILTSSVLLWMNFQAPGSYDLVWRVVTVLLAIGQVLLVCEAYRNLTRYVRWQFPIGMILTGACTATVAAAALVRILAPRPYAWPWSHLETIFALAGVENICLGFVMVGIVLASEWNSSIQHWHARILTAYLLLSGPCYYAASEHIDTIGRALMIVAALCYGAWLWLAIKSARGLEAA